MAEAAVLSATLESILQPPLEKAIVLASEKFSLLMGFKKDMARFKKYFQMVQAFLHDEQRREVTGDAIKIWLQELEALAYDADNVLDGLSYEILRQKIEIGNSMRRKLSLFFSHSNPIALHFKMAHRVQEILTKLKDINKDAKDLGLQYQMATANVAPIPSVAGSVFRETDSINMDSNVIGRDDEASEIVKMLISPSDKILSIIPITGMGGIGKTTLAREVFNDQQIQEKFDKHIWVCVAENFDVMRLFDQMLESLTGKKVETDTREAKVKILQEELRGKKYLLVLDDLWNDFLGSLKGISITKGNFILVTTRSTDVASMMATYPPFPLSQLSEDDCWIILKEKAFDGGEVPEELQAIGREIAQKCQGLPLLAKILGGMLFNRGRDEWISVPHNMLHLLSEDENYVMQILKVSFDRLPSPAAKNFFQYCSIFPKDYDIERKQLIQLWMAEGFLETILESKMEIEDVGDKIFNILLQSSLLQDVKKDDYGNILCCKMHHLVHDLAQSISRSTFTWSRWRGTILIRFDILQ